MLRHNNKYDGGAQMKVMLIAGKALAGLFWLSLLGAVGGLLAKPFDQLLSLLALVLVGVHCIELWLFGGAFAGRDRPWLDRLQVMAFGVFHLSAMQLAPAPEAQAQQDSPMEVAHA